MTVFFIGAGPGDPELITVKGQRLIQNSPVILYAGSLVPAAILADRRADAEVIDSSALHLDEIIDVIKLAHSQGLDVARVHSGDPSLYGAIGEQIRCLKDLKIPFEVIPGVTSTSAAAAVLGQELTLSGVSQSIVLTRYAGKTPMPAEESLINFAKTKSTLAIHLGITRIHKIVDDLKPFYGETCPIIVCYRVGWPDQEIIKGTLLSIVEQVRQRKINRTALILVGHVLGTDQFDDSYLYQSSQAHIYRPKVRSSKQSTPNIEDVNQEKNYHDDTQ